MAVARDKFWMFGVRPHQDDYLLGKHNDNRRYAWSRITPAEAAFMLDVPNIMLINCDGEPAPFSTTAYGYAESFCRMKKVLWGATGSSGFRIGNEEKFICDLAEKYPNIGGAFMDDCLGKFRSLPDGERDKKAIELLSEIRSGLDKASHYMQIYATCYTTELELFSPEVFNYFDGLTMWTWSYKEIPQILEKYEKIEKRFPDKQKLLGIYMYDFPSGQPVPDDYMKIQCELGLKLMIEGRLDGMIFEANSVMGVGLPSEYWLRNWVERVKYTEVPDIGCYRC
jgi:hypothetical protein